MSRTQALRAASGQQKGPAPRASRASRQQATDDDEDREARTRGPILDAEQLYAAEIGKHYLLTAAEEQALSRRLEEVEITLWKRLLRGPLAAEARAQLLALDPPVDPRSGREARAADLDRLVATRVLAAGRESATRAEKRAIAEMRALAAEADRIRERFATCNLRMVPATVHRHGYHLTSNLSMGDLIQEGNLGLLRAIPRFDYRRGLRFGTFATWWIRHYLSRARQNLSSEVRVPVHLQDLAAKVRIARTKLRRKLDRNPSQDEVAQEIEVSKKSLETLEADWPKYRESLSTFDVAGNEDEKTPAYLTSEAPLADERLARHQANDKVATAVESMPPILAQIVRRHFGIGGTVPETLNQIGDSMQLSSERIRQLEKKALTMLRETLEAVTGLTDLAA